MTPVSVAQYINMHDFLLAKQIIDELKNIIQEKKLRKVKRVNLEIGQISLSHDGHPEHVEDISVENLRFGLAGIAKGTNLENIEFNIIKVPGGNWKITDIEI